MNTVVDSVILSYLGGFFDGEGSISPMRGGPQRGYVGGILVKVSQKDRTALEVFKRLWDGNIYNDGLVWAWQVARKASVLVFLEDIEPFLMGKRLQARLAMSLLILPKTTFRSGPMSYSDAQIDLADWIHDKISLLNHKPKTGVR